MLKALFDTIIATGQKAMATQTLETNDGNTILLLKDGAISETHEKKIFAEFLNVKVLSIADMVKAIDTFAPVADSNRERFEAIADSGEARPVVFVSIDQVRVILDAETYADHIRMPIDLTKAFETLRGLDKAFDQRALLKFLRIDLDQTGAEAVVAEFRSLQWNRADGASGTVNHADESLGRSIEETVQNGQSTIPQEFSVTVPVFQNEDLADIMFTFRIVVTLNFDSKTIQLTVPPVVCERSVWSSLDAVFRRVEKELGDSASVVRGQP